MKKLINACLFTLIFILLSSFETDKTNPFEESSDFIETVTTEDPCSTLIRAWKGTLFGREGYFSSYACASNAGATNIFPGGMQPSCIVFTCINGL